MFTPLSNILYVLLILTLIAFVCIRLYILFYNNNVFITNSSWCDIDYVLKEENTYFCRYFDDENGNKKYRAGPECNIDNEVVSYYKEFFDFTGIMIMGNKGLNYHGPIHFKLGDNFEFTYVIDPPKKNTNPTLVYYLTCPNNMNMFQLAEKLIETIKTFNDIPKLIVSHTVLQKGNMLASKIPIKVYNYTYRERNTHLGKYIGTCNNDLNNNIIICKINDSFCPIPPVGRGKQMVGPYCNISYNSRHLGDNSYEFPMNKNFTMTSGILFIVDEFVGPVKRNIFFHISFKFSETFSMSFNMSGAGTFYIECPRTYTIKQLSDSIYDFVKGNEYGDPPVTLTSYVIDNSKADKLVGNLLQEKLYHRPDIPIPGTIVHVNSDFFRRCSYDDTGVTCKYTNRNFRNKYSKY